MNKVKLLIVILFFSTYIVGFSQEQIEVEQGDILLNSVIDTHVGLRLKQNVNDIFANVEIERFGNTGELIFNNSINWSNGGGTFNAMYHSAIARIDTRDNLRGYSWLWSKPNDANVLELLRLTSDGDLILDSNPNSSPLINSNRPKLRVRMEDNDFSGILIENDDGGAHSWLPYTDGSIYLTGDRSDNRSGNIHLRSFVNGSYTDHMRIVPSFGFNGTALFYCAIEGREGVSVYNSGTGMGTGLRIINEDSQNKKWIINRANDVFDEEDSALKFVFQESFIGGSSLTVPRVLEEDGDWVLGSDRRLKKNISNLNSTQIENIKKLNPTTYEYKAGTSGKKFGFIAQEVQKIYPELVSSMASGNLGINYEGLIPLLTKAIQEQQAVIEKLQDRLDKLEQK